MLTSNTSTEESNVMTFPTSRAPMYAGTLALSQDQLVLRHVRFGEILLTVGGNIKRFAVDYGNNVVCFSYVGDIPIESG